MADIPTEAYPLTWPASRPRTKASDRQRARFSRTNESTSEWRGHDGQMHRSTYRRAQQVTVAVALDRLRVELERMGADGVIISTNIPVRLDGDPRSGHREPDDSGAAVYFRLKSEPYCLPCDRWDRVADNIAAIAAHVAAMRGMERWGVGRTSDHFAGFKALPPSGGTTVGSQGPAWWNVLGVQPNTKLDVIRAAYRALASQNHPDLGGDAGAMAAINRAWEQAQAQVG